MNDEPGYELVMPFVVVTSVGGPYDDDAFAAGYTLGQIAKELDDSSRGRLETMVPTPLVPQCDLLAMHYGYVVASEPWEEAPDEWTSMVFTRVTEPVPR